MLHPIKHFLVVARHRRKVRKYCFKLGLYSQGLKHDLSKYSFKEFYIGMKYFKGYESPNTSERKKYGYSKAWLNHKGRNKHHFEYWTYFSHSEQKYVFVKMPINYLKECLCDRIAATEIYNGKNYNDKMPLEYFITKQDELGMHKETAAKLQQWLTLVSELGKKEAFKIIKKEKDY